ncbi:hypothetical protein ES332_D09G109500v1 [Gossypium tomentosum]|nr:hypothetical protein ES332_D09G109500v1 [Gossypium tomentosum]
MLRVVGKLCFQMQRENFLSQRMIAGQIVQKMDMQGTLTQYYEQLPVSLENLRLYTGNTEARDLKTSCQCKVVLTKW